LGHRIRGDNVVKLEVFWNQERVHLSFRGAPSGWSLCTSTWAVRKSGSAGEEGSGVGYRARARDDADPLHVSSSQLPTHRWRRETERMLRRRWRAASPRVQKRDRGKGTGILGAASELPLRTSDWRSMRPPSTPAISWMRKGTWLVLASLNNHLVMQRRLFAVRRAGFERFA
jgi:hypothetical protein